MILMNQGTYRSIHTETILMVKPAHTLTASRLIKRKEFKFIVSIMVAVLIFTSFLLIAIDASGTEPLKLEEKIVTVGSGDTLWDIASLHAMKGDDIGYIVYKIKNRNDLSTVTIVPGQKLIIPKLN
ncbi:LysM peptidoglycan-binding domain-containing protein [Paenibacillus sp. L3-i20]|uniref:LysM peptidoglycan-binding domain-containing protein n=1 Tax=Paenibacillus sp. L3-i20 TaxID=2905833 RepID=UPI001EDCB370|nr:LysM peptidoglycan-binding domain-containing protein [Paenibacillus sp. L3-i20]GKU79351.1 hypothetical protein L3i20_v237480 [Paenibacillus sp. L3-i20]